ncbi:uncharacterized protein LOC117225717 isoform X2 [Megalopta genalis]|uniref:uncharacterized protein LOC117225717 isoform X2 n=1 Tax=Megalopta genalis TaxID=115081 RepID=UPI001442FF40|nr:uncharacterized protein LOC117225717 [Megalopta genalis]
MDPSMSRKCRLKRKDVFDFLHEKKSVSTSTTVKVRDSIYKYIVKECNFGDLDENSEDELKEKIRTFCTALSVKWKANHRVLDKFLLKCSDWLEKPFFQIQENTKSGRPRKEFFDASERTKRRSVEHLLLKHSPQELEYAVIAAHRRSGKRTLARAIEGILTKSPESLKKLFEPEKTFTPYTPQEALAMIASLRLTKRQYCSLRQGAMEKGFALYPSYTKLLGEKKTVPCEIIDNCNLIPKVEVQAL